MLIAKKKLGLESLLSRAPIRLSEVTPKLLMSLMIVLEISFRALMIMSLHLRMSLVA